MLQSLLFRLLWTGKTGGGDMGSRRIWVNLDMRKRAANGSLGSNIHDADASVKLPDSVAFGLSWTPRPDLSFETGVIRSTGAETGYEGWIFDLADPYIDLMSRSSKGRSGVPGVVDSKMESGDTHIVSLSVGRKL